MQENTVADFDKGLLTEAADLLYQSRQDIAGALSITISRFEKPEQLMPEDMALLEYHYNKGGIGENFIQLKYCLTGNMYCRQFAVECQNCRMQNIIGCNQKIETVDVVSLRFSEAYFRQFAAIAGQQHLSEELISFSYTSSFSRSLPLCFRSRQVLDQLLKEKFDGSRQVLWLNAQAQMLLVYTMDCLGEKEPEVVVCRFLNNEADREKLLKAREILLQHIGEPITIRQLSRKVAMNECYLKKGFKEMFGTTIFEFYQQQRMQHAKYLLYEKGLNVTEVASLLGYSSISHFSTAFKKHTGIKPCELLLR